MKRHISKQDFLTLPPKAQALIFEWQKKKGYPYDYALSIGDCIELLMDITRKIRHDDGYNGWRDHVFELDEFIISWEGEEFLDALWYELTRALKKYIAFPFIG